MELADKTAVITGAAAGIGRAMAVRFAQEGARGVVVSDIDGDGAVRVAAEIDAERPGSAIAVPCDVADRSQTQELVRQAEERFGPVDLFCANAGIGGGMGLEASDEEWDAALAVNVRAHIVAAQLLVPGWVERGEGYFLSTASAAGLLTMVGSAPYAVTKHAAVAFAEWLALTYGDQGVRVSCLCPMAVRTQLLEAGLELPGETGAGLRITVGSGQLLEPSQIADAVVAGIASERFLILPHPEVQQMAEGKVADRDAWLAALRAVRNKVLASPAP
jgi:NAD(P)-dependent dehydrogenase (short-subunit alcohol dehydrogenase family)